MMTDVDSCIHNSSYVAATDKTCIAIVGPTASGKSGLAIEVAKR